MNKKISITKPGKTLTLFTLTCLIVVGIIAGYTYMIKRTYLKEKTQVIREASISVDAFEQHTAQIVNQVDVILRSVRMEYLRSFSNTKTEQFIIGLNLDTTVFENIFLVRNDGTFIIPYDENSTLRNVVDREYFRYHQANAADNLFISAVEKGYITGKYRFRITRRIDNSDGSFGGVVIATVNPQSFINYYEELNIGSKNVATLIGTLDNKIRARIPEPSPEIWSTPIKSPLTDTMQDLNTGNFQYRSVIDNIQRFFIYKKVRNLPLAMIVGFSDEDVKNRIQQQKNLLILISAISIILTLIISLVLHKVIKTETLRQKTEAKYRRMVDTAIEGVLSLDSNSRITFANQQIATMLGYTIEEMIGKNYNFFLPEDQIKENTTQMKIRSQGQDAVYERCFLRKNGSRHWIIVSAKSVINSNGKFEGSFAMFTDINKRKKLEAEREILITKLAEKNSSLAKLNATKDRLFGIIAHDLKGPLGTFMQMTGLMLDKYDQITEVKKKHYISLLKNNASNVFSLLENLLTWSQSQRDGIQPNYEKVNLKINIEKIVQLFHIMAENKNISIKLNLKGYKILETDKHLFTTILRNLVSNALKFTRAGGNIIVSTENLDNYIRISVQDSGIGIEPKNLKKLFQIQTDVSTIGTSGEKGTGLGLILCKDLVEKMGGKLELKSIVNVGTTFSFILPVNQI